MQDKDLATLRTLSNEELIKMILTQNQMLSEKEKKISDLENRVAILE